MQDEPVQHHGQIDIGDAPGAAEILLAVAQQIGRDPQQFGGIGCSRRPERGQLLAHQPHRVRAEQQMGGGNIGGDDLQDGQGAALAGFPGWRPLISRRRWRIGSNTAS